MTETLTTKGATLTRVRRVGRILAAILVVLATLAVTQGIAAAHTPHDPIGHVVLSPDYARDHTMFVISDVRVMRSTNNGESWQEITRRTRRADLRAFRDRAHREEDHVPDLTGRRRVSLHRSG